MEKPNAIEVRQMIGYQKYRKEKIWEMYQAILPEYLSVFTGEDEEGRPNVQFRLACAWAKEAAEYSYNLHFEPDLLTEEKTHEEEDTDEKTSTEEKVDTE